MMTARTSKYQHAMDKENVAPQFDAENLLPPLLITPGAPKKKHQETNHYLDLHTPNDKNKHPDDNTPDSNTPNHSMELTSEEINEKCKLLKLKIQRMREIAANDTGNLSSNITDDLNNKKKEDKETSSEIVQENQPAPTPTSHARIPLQTLSAHSTTPNLVSAGSTPFGAPKQSSHIPQQKAEVPPAIPSSNLRARRFGMHHPSFDITISINCFLILFQGVSYRNRQYVSASQRKKCHRTNR